MKEDIRNIIFFMKNTEVSFRFFSISIFFSILLTIVNLYVIKLLFPLLKGIIEGNFEHVKYEKILGYFIENSSFLSNSIRLFILLIIWLYIVVIFKNILQYLISINTDYQSKKAALNMRVILINKYLQFEKSFFDINKIHIISSILKKSGSVIEKQFLLLKNLIVQIFLALMFLSVMFYISVGLTLAALIVLPFITFFVRIYIKKIKKNVQDFEKTSNILSQKISNILNGILIIKSFVKEDEERNEFKKISNIEISKNFKSKKITSLLPIIEDVSATTALLLLAFAAAFVTYKTGIYIDSTKAFVFLYISQRMIPILNSFNSFSVGMINLKNDIKEINEILQESDSHIVYSGNKIFSEMKKGIEIEKLNFKYQDAKEKTISNLSMYIPKGKITAIVGPTGSGKSTIVNLLMRFYDVEANTVFIDGVDIRNFDISTLRKRIAYVGQEPVFFTDTIFNNISYGMKKNM